MCKDLEVPESKDPLSEFNALWWEGLKDDSWYYLAHSGNQKWKFELPKLLKVILHPGNDRLLSVKKQIPPNTLIYKFTPIVSTYNETQETDETIASKIYSNFQPFDDETSNVLVRLVIKIFVACEQSSETKQHILSLKHQKSHFEENIGHVYANQLICYRIVDTLAKGIENKAEKMIKRLVVYINTLLCIAQINFANFMDIEEVSVGFFLDPIFSLINHSCLPNIKPVRENTFNNSLRLVSTLPIKQNLYTNYCSRLFPTPTRQYDLQRRFNFQCQCELCSNSIDYLFSYNCPKCQSVLCYPKFSSFLYDHNATNVKFVSGINLQCKNCKFTVNFKTFQRNYLLHKLSILIIIFLSQDIDADYQPVNNFQEFLQQIKSISPRYVLNYNFYMEKLTNLTFEYGMPPNAYKLFKIMIQMTINDRIIPSYCFPFGIFYQAFQIELNERYGRCQLTGIKQDPDFLFQQLTVHFQTTFLINIPADLTRQYRVANPDYRYIALDLWILIKYIKSLKPDYQEMLEMLTWNCMFFCSRALETYHGHCIDIFWELEQLYFRIREDHFEFVKNPFEKYLIPLLNFTKVSSVFSYKKKKLSINMMSRMKMEIFDENRDLLTLRVN